MVLTLPARSSFDIIARHKGLGGGFGCVLPLRARAGRTCEALAIFLPHKLFCCCQFFEGESVQ